MIVDLTHVITKDIENVWPWLSNTVHAEAKTFCGQSSSNVARRLESHTWVLVSFLQTYMQEFKVGTK